MRLGLRIWMQNWQLPIAGSAADLVSQGATKCHGQLRLKRRLRFIFKPPSQQEFERTYGRVLVKTPVPSKLQFYHSHNKKVKVVLITLQLL